MDRPYQFSWSAQRLKFPVEILTMFCTWLAFEDLRAMAAASQYCWRAACPFLWQNVRSLRFLLSAIAGEDVDSIQMPSVRQAVAPPNKLGASFDCRTLGGYQRISPWVQTIRIYNKWSVHPLYLAGDLTNLLADNARHRPLFPALRQICVGKAPWDKPFMSASTWFSGAQSLNLVGMLLHGGVEHLGIRCKPATVDIVKLMSLAPSLKGLYLVADHENNDDEHREGSTDEGSTDEGSTDDSSADEGSADSDPASSDSEKEEIWTVWVMQCLSGWNSLTKLGISSCMLTSDTAAPLGTIPLLAHLTIVYNGQGHRGALKCNTDSFPCLTHLSVVCAPPSDALALCGFAELMGKLTRLDLSLKDFGAILHVEDGRIVARICEMAPRLQHLRLGSSCPTVLDLQLLRQLQLISLAFDGSSFSDRMATSLLDLSPTLESLDVRTLRVPVTFLARLAAAYPGLRVLKVRPVLDRDTDLDREELDTRIDGQITLYGEAECEFGMDREATETYFLRYVRRVWANVDIDE